MLTLKRKCLSCALHEDFKKMVQYIEYLRTKQNKPHFKLYFIQISLKYFEKFLKVIQY